VIAGNGPLPPDRAVEIVAQIADALDAAHAEGLVHRDVKPSNVLVTGSKRDFAYLADFGIVGNVGAAGATLTSTGVTVGTLDYMAPERFTDTGDRRVDVYALACVLFQMMTARRPFCVDAIPALMYAHVSSPPPAPSSFQSGVPTALDEVVARGMAKDPDDRYPSAGRLASAARAALTIGTGDASHPATPSSQRTAPPPLRHAPAQPAADGDIGLIEGSTRAPVGRDDRCVRSTRVGTDAFAGGPSAPYPPAPHLDRRRQRHPAHHGALRRGCSDDLATR
jgi:serine/threonine-protein kinase